MILPPKNKRAEMGMGTLIIFIAMILVAATAATVLINTTSSLQNAALTVGKSTQQEIGTSLQFIEVFGTDAQDSSIETLFATLKISAGSSAIKLADLYVSLTLHNASSDFTFDENINCSDSGSISQSFFGVERIVDGGQSIDGYMTRGDVYRMCFGSVQPIREGESFRIGVIPKVGLPARLLLSAPDILFTLRAPLYP
jgi:archaeal flagellin FlaB